MKSEPKNRPRTTKATPTAEPRPLDIGKLNIPNIMISMKKEAYEPTTIERVVKELKHLERNCKSQARRSKTMHSQIKTYQTHRKKPALRDRSWIEMESFGPSIPNNCNTCWMGAKAKLLLGTTVNRFVIKGPSKGHCGIVYSALVN